MVGHKDVGYGGILSVEYSEDDEDEDDKSIINSTEEKGRKCVAVKMGHGWVCRHTTERIIQRKAWVLIFNSPCFINFN